MFNLAHQPFSKIFACAFQILLWKYNDKDKCVYLPIS